MGVTQVKDCNTQHVLHSNKPVNMNWPDGNVPVSYSFILPSAPQSGCIQAFVDGNVQAAGVTYVKLM
jgi:prepilin-type processing-associated H-X9-DG protein